MQEGVWGFGCFFYLFIFGGRNKYVFIVKGWFFFVDPLGPVSSMFY